MNKILSKAEFQTALQKYNEGLELEHVLRHDEYFLDDGYLWILNRFDDSHYEFSREMFTTIDKFLKWTEHQGVNLSLESLLLILNAYDEDFILEHIHSFEEVPINSYVDLSKYERVRTFVDHILIREICTITKESFVQSI